MEKASIWVGLDVHKESIDVTIAEDGAAREVRHFGTIGGDLEAVAKMLERGASRLAQARLAQAPREGLNLLRNRGLSKRPTPLPGWKAQVSEELRLV